jgi:hypothetical protein
MVCLKFSPYHLYSWAKEETLHSSKETYILVKLLGFFLGMGQLNLLIFIRKKKNKGTWDAPHLFNKN